MSERYLTVAEVAARLRICRNSVYNLVDRGELPAPVHFGRSARWRLSELEAHEAKIGAARHRLGLTPVAA
ncbi:MAG TPA: helix-turn-helix domain-containing protein [Phenylobacterium sp.]|jgi:excisionase family DNA binding protein|uniref:helix-turn-helix transcriptional regulator n=1 Tax=Phenylobacterium sp. TaxID=1871053 RepID=UPI002C438DC1|nr:helix-turn-helix domain-containing protein [Phenylobacterium sp.]HXA39651.1 helix-turn-helix domain-containing protein [Phenylobacterium sp.]